MADQSQRAQSRADPQAGKAEERLNRRHNRDDDIERLTRPELVGMATLFTGMLSVTKAQEYYTTSGSQHAKIYAEKLLYLGGGAPYDKEATAEGKPRLLSERVHEIYLGGSNEWSVCQLDLGSSALLVREGE